MKLSAKFTVFGLALIVVADVFFRAVTFATNAGL